MSKNFQAILGTSTFLCAGRERLKADALRDLGICSRLPITCLSQAWKNFGIVNKFLRKQRDRDIRLAQLVHRNIMLDHSSTLICF